MIDNTQNLFSSNGNNMTYYIALANQLKNELRAAANAYYNTGSPIMTDEQYDYKLNKLALFEQKLNIDLGSSIVGAPVLSGVEETILDPPMLSLEKCHSVEEIKSFSAGQQLIATAKCDGVSTRLIYKDGVLVEASTRGDGIIGTNITEHCKHYTNIPQEIRVGCTVIIDGESIIKDNDFETIKDTEGLKNSRNAVAGTLNSLNVRNTIARKLSFIAWDVVYMGNKETTQLNYYDKLQWLESFNFEVVPWQVVYLPNDDLNKMNEYITNMAEKYCHIPTDGVVYKINNAEEGIKRGRTAHHFCNAIAFKPQYEEYCTHLRKIDYDVSRQGILTPVAVFDPVIIDGTEVSRASLSNISILKSTLGEHPFVGQEIYVIKANKIIPMIVRAKDEYEEWI